MFYLFFERATQILRTTIAFLPLSYELPASSNIMPMFFNAWNIFFSVKMNAKLKFKFCIPSVYYFLLVKLNITYFSPSLDVCVWYLFSFFDAHEYIHIILTFLIRKHGLLNSNKTGHSFEFWQICVF